jgi:hypothetical protein
MQYRGQTYVVNPVQQMALDGCPHTKGVDDLQAVELLEVDVLRFPPPKTPGSPDQRRATRSKPHGLEPERE